MASNAHHDGGDEDGPYEDALHTIFSPIMAESDWMNDNNDEDDDDDGEYVDEEEEEDEDDVDEDELFQDAEEGEIGVRVVVEEATAGAETTGEAPGDGTTPTRRRIISLIGGIGQGNGAGYLTERQLVALLRGQDLGHILLADEEEDAEIRWSRRRRRIPKDPNRFPVVPSEEGRKLMDSGLFGASDRRLSERQQKKKLARRILERELGIGDRAYQRENQSLMVQEMIPASEPEMVIRYEDPVCCGQFSDDGNFFYACVKDFKVRMYDTSNPYNWKHYKTHSHPFGQWTLTDADLSPDNKWLVFASLDSTVCFAPTDPSDTGDPYTLDLGDTQGGMRHHGGWWSRSSFPIYSIRFSGDGRELIAGTGADSVVVFDIESRQVLHHVRGHDNDVNAVCFADKSSSHILYSGSDDTTIKVWDRRSMGDGREAGAFVGHIEGLTYIDTKGDGRYILSNAKESSMKLWDLRMAMSTARFQELDPTQHTRHSGYDYRWQNWDDSNWFRHVNDNSLVTFRGHKIQRTLIRCHFSPPGSSDSRYVYSGSQDGFVYVWNLDATLATRINVREATRPLRPDGRRHRQHGSSGWASLVRDVGWHPNAPLLVASAWNGYNHSSGTASLHSFNEAPDDEAEPKMGFAVNDTLGPELPEADD